MNWIKALDDELVRARTKFPRKYASGHEAYAVIREELEEYWEHVKADTYMTPGAKKELIQIAAMCVRAIEDFTSEERI